MKTSYEAGESFHTSRLDRERRCLLLALLQLPSLQCLTRNSIPPSRASLFRRIGAIQVTWGGLGHVARGIYCQFGNMIRIAIVSSVSESIV